VQTAPEAPKPNFSRRFYLGLAVLALLVLVFFIAPVYPQTTEARILVGRSPNCSPAAEANLTCGIVTQTGIPISGYSSVSYAMFGVGNPTSYHSTATIVLQTVNFTAPGHTAYIITVNGAPDMLTTTANTTRGEVPYQCVTLIPDGVKGFAAGPDVATLTLADGTTQLVPEC
jgi:hypothetical protein